MTAMLKAKFRVRHVSPPRHVVLTINPAAYASSPKADIGANVAACAVVAAGVDSLDDLAFVGIWRVGDAKAEIKFGERLPQ
jgi:hypothetical protein